MPNGTGTTPRSLLWDVGDLVRFERFGEWLNGTIILVRDGLVCIEYGSHGGTTWKQAGSRSVIARQPGEYVDA